MVELIQNAYNVFEQMHLSITGLLVAALVFSLAFLFAVREAASWFFKVDDLKRDIRRLHEVTTQLEGEIKVIQSLLTQVREPLEKKASHLEPVGAKTAAEAPAQPESKSSAFPIVH